MQFTPTQIWMQEHFGLFMVVLMSVPPFIMVVLFIYKYIEEKLEERLEHNRERREKLLTTGKTQKPR